MPVTLQDSFVTLLEIGYVIVMIAILVVLFKRRSLDNPQESRWLRNFILVMMLSLVVAVFGSWAIRHGHYGHRRQAKGNRDAEDTVEQEPGSRVLLSLRTSLGPANFQWPLTAGVAGLLLLGGVLILAPAPSSQPIRRPAIRMSRIRCIQTIDTTIDDIPRNKEDTRKAVIANYAEHGICALASHRLAQVPPLKPRSSTWVESSRRRLRVRPEISVRSLAQISSSTQNSVVATTSIGKMKEAAIEAWVTIRADLNVRKSVAA